MKILFEKTRLLDKLLPMMGSVSNKNTISSLEGILIETQEGGLVRFSAFDMKKGMVSLLEAEVIEPGSFIINAARFLQIVRVMPEDRICLQVDDKLNATLSSGQSSFSLFALRGSDFPSMPILSGESGLEVSADILKKMIGKVIHSVADNDSRAMLCGAFFRIYDGMMEVVSCDSFTLSVCKKRCEIRDIGRVSMPEFSFILPGHALNELLKVLPEGEEKINLFLTRKHAIFKMDEGTFFTRLIDEDYIDYHRIMPKEQTIFIEVNRERLLKGLERVNLIAEEKGQGNSRSYVKMIIDGDWLMLTSISVSGKVEDELDCVHRGEGLEIGFNCRYLINSVRAAEGETVVMSFKGARQSMTIEPKEQNEEDSFFYMVLPVKMGEA